jgi:hypothetical protein
MGTGNGGTAEATSGHCLILNFFGLLLRERARTSRSLAGSFSSLYLSRCSETRFTSSRPALAS